MLAATPSMVVMLAGLGAHDFPQLVQDEVHAVVLDAGNGCTGAAIVHS
jgi:hypothetical protein